LKFRFNQINIISQLLKNVNLQNFDIIVFLAYEEISVSLLWPNNNKTFLINHNNIDNVNKSFFKKVFFRLMPSNIVHTVFNDFSKRYLKRTFKKNG